MLSAVKLKSLSIYDKNDIKKLSKHYKEYKDLMEAIEENPYYVFCGILKWTFPFADKIINKKFPNKYYRCMYAMMYILKNNANIYGNTKMKADEMYNDLYKIIKEDSSYCVQIIDKDTESVFHFDKKENTIGLYSLYICEKNIANEINKRLAIRTEYNNKWDIFKYRNCDGVELTSEQMQILEFARTYGVCILSGGAGTGKSATTKALVGMLEDNYMSYAMVAPTGIAAKRLRDATEKDASTIHMYLLNSEEKVDYIIIDEFSMVGVELLNMLLTHESITENTRFIFICDEAQLASISPGNIIKNLLDFNKIPTVKLTKVFRYGIGGIATIATDIRNGESPDFEHEWEDFLYVEYDDSVKEQIKSAFDNAIESGYSLNDILFLTPKKIGNLGTYRLNSMIQYRYTNGKELRKFDYIIKDRGQEYFVSFQVGDKVINIKNNYNALTSSGKCSIIMNGEIGIVTRVKIIDDEEYLCVQFDNEEIAYSKKEIRNLQLAYALTCHKVQGQQAKCVIFLAHEDSAFMLTRNLMYVAVSRAQEMLYIIGNKNIISDGVKKVETNSRMTYLNKLLED